MTQTLREIYLANQAANVLIEALDEESLRQVSQVIEVLRGLKKFNLPSLTGGIDKMIKELNAYSGGGGVAKAWEKLKSKMGADNPVVRAIAFASALEGGIMQLPNIVKNNVEVEADPEDLEKFGDKTLTQILTQPEGAGQHADAGVGENSAAAFENLKKIMTKALVPKGRYSVLGFGSYVKQGALVKDLTNTPLKVLDQMYAEINRSGQPASKLISSQKLNANLSPDGGVPAKPAPVATANSSQGTTAGTPNEAPPGDAAAATGGKPQGQTAAGTVPGATGPEATGGKAGTKAAPGGAPTGVAAGGKIQLPDFMKTMQAIGAKNLDSPANKKTVDAFKRFYDYLAKNSSPLTK